MSICNHDTDIYSAYLLASIILRSLRCQLHAASRSLGQDKDALGLAGNESARDLACDSGIDLHLVLVLKEPAAQVCISILRMAAEADRTHFLIVGRETPVRDSSLCVAMHSLIISMVEGRSVTFAATSVSGNYQYRDRQGKEKQPTLCGGCLLLWRSGLLGCGLGGLDVRHCEWIEEVGW